MEKAKSSVKDFLSKTGHHDTTVHETVAPAVQNETVTPTRHTDVTTAVEQETHQDHYHTTVQPIKHQETLAEQHHHNIVPVEHRQVEHDNPDQVKEKLAREQAQFQSTSERAEGQHTTSTAPVVAGEHVHHHVHENIQPVVQKQTIEPHVVHTTVPIHEVHHNEAKHHATSALPAMSMDDFKKQGGTLGGDKERFDKYEGCPPESIGGHSNYNSASVPSNGMSGATRDVPVSNGMSSSNNGASKVSAATAAATAATSSLGKSSTSSSGNSSGITSGHSDGPFNSHKHDPAR